MSDLISREAAWEEIKKVPLINPDRMAFKLQQALWDVPAVDAAPVVQGKWIPYYGGQNYKCSVCNEISYLSLKNGKPSARYCLNCGSKMDGGEQDGSNSVRCTGI